MSKILEDIGKVMEFTTNKLKEESGNNKVSLEVGDEVVTVFNNGVLILSMEEGRHLKTKVVLEEPYKMDFSVRLN